MFQKYLKNLGSLIWRCLVKRCFNIKHFKDKNFFQSFASIGRVDLVLFINIFIYDNIQVKTFLFMTANDSVLCKSTTLSSKES